MISYLIFKFLISLKEGDEYAKLRYLNDVSYKNWVSCHRSKQSLVAKISLSVTAVPLRSLTFYERKGFTSLTKYCTGTFPQGPQQFKEVDACLVVIRKYLTLLAFAFLNQSISIDYFKRINSYPFQTTTENNDNLTGDRR